MSKYTPKNERIKEAYYRYLGEVDGKSASTIDGVCKSIVRFEEYIMLLRSYLIASPMRIL